DRLGDDDAACFVDNEMGGHIGMIMWVEPSINAIFFLVPNRPVISERKSKPVSGPLSNLREKKSPKSEP
ncbi:MAG: hypothetical protein WCA58_16040, partial [Terriglobales bacterium]